MLDISFIIPAYNEEKNIARCLESISSVMRSELYSFEVVVCDHSSADETQKIAKSFGVKIVQISRGGNVALVRNRGAEVAVGKFYIFLDADIELTYEWANGLTAVVESLSSNPMQIIGSFCLPPKDDNYIIQNWFVHTTKGGSGYLGTAHLITSRECFNQLRGFDERLVTGEDYDFCSRCKMQGGTIDIRPEMIVYHHDYPRTTKAFVLREAWHGEGDFQSFDNFLKSKVAILTVIFMLLHFLAIASLMDNYYFIYLIIVIICLFVFACTFLKFKSLGVISILKSTVVMYIYFLGRSMSLFRVIGKYWNSSKEVKV